MSFLKPIENRNSLSATSYLNLMKI